MITRFITVLCSLFLLVSCSEKQQTKVTSYDTSRIIVLGGAVGETVYALGAGSKVVAADLSCVWPAEIQQVPKVGYHRQLSAEGVLSLKPSLILLTDAAGPPAAVELLKNSGVPVIVLSHTPDAATVESNIRQTAEALGLQEQGEKLVQKVKNDLEAAANATKVKGQEMPKVLFLLGASNERLNAAGKKTSAEEIVRLAGGRLVFEDFEGYKPVSPESVTAAGPDIILYPSAATHGTPTTTEWIKQPALAETPAVRDGKVYAVDLALMAGFGPRLGEAALELHKLLYQQ